MRADEEPADSRQSTDAMDRLRDRTDELELIISSLTIFALYTLPGWLFDSFAATASHLSTSLMIVSTVGITLATGVSYGLATCFVVHLMTRAYWVGLIGLRSVFPAGINWNRTFGIGPLTKERHKAKLPDLDTVIARTDRIASSLFAIISLITLGVLWFGLIMLVTLVIAAQIGGRVGGTNAGLSIATLLLLTIFGGFPLLLWLADALFARRFPGLQQNRVFVAIVKALGGVVGLIYPQRLILPVQLTLQSNTRPVVYFLASLICMAAIVTVGNLRFQGWGSFTISNEFVFLGDEDVRQGFRSPYYEDMASPKDRIRAWPRIDSFTQTGSFARVFLPYQPLRDNLILERLCQEQQETTVGAECLRRIWSIDLDGQAIELEDFITAERMDLQMRGLIGIAPLAGLTPGLHRLDIVWNPTADEDEVPIDDRYVVTTQLYSIPFVFTPGYELSVGETLSEAP